MDKGYDLKVLLVEKVEREREQVLTLRTCFSFIGILLCVPMWM